MFTDQTSKLKKVVTKVKHSLKFTKKKSTGNSKNGEDGDPQFSAAQSHFKESPAKSGSRKEKQRRKDFCNNSILLFNELARCFHSYKKLMRYEDLQLETKYNEHLGAFKKEMTMANKILIGTQYDQPTFFFSIGGWLVELPPIFINIERIQTTQFYRFHRKVIGKDLSFLNLATLWTL